MGDGNGSGTTVMGDDGGSKMDGRTAVHLLCAASRSQWTAVAVMGNGRDAAT